MSRCVLSKCQQCDDSRPLERQLFVEHDFAVMVRAGFVA